jgi:hypothetical protein
MNTIKRNGSKYKYVENFINKNQVLEDQDTEE